MMALMAFNYSGGGLSSSVHADVILLVSPMVFTRSGAGGSQEGRHEPKAAVLTLRARGHHNPET